MQDLPRLGNEVTLPRQVRLELTEATIELLLPVDGALGFALQRRLLHAQPSRRRCPSRLVLAQRLHRIGDLGFLAQRLGFDGRRLAEHAKRLRERGFLGDNVRLGLSPMQMKQHRLGPADFGRQLLVALHLTRLPLEPVDLRAELGEDVREPREVDLGRLEPQLGLVPAAVETGHTGGILEHPAALLGLGIHDLGDLALPDKGRRARASSGILEQDLDIAGARVLAVDAIARALLALNAPRDLDDVALVEVGRRGAGAVVDENGDLGDVARGSRRRARKYDIVHGSGAHGLVRGLAHYPPQRLEQVGLAAAVGPDDAGQPVLDDELRRLDERFESEKPQSVDMHRWRSPRDPLRASGIRAR